MENTNSGIKPWQWVVTAVVIIVLIIIGIMVFGNKGAEAPVITEEPAIVDNTNTTNRIVMSDQYPGNVAYVSSVQLANPGWVVIQKNTAGKPGDIIGTAYVGAGISPVKVTLSQPMADGLMYYATLYSDNGDKKFDAKTDLAIKDASGNVIMKTFKATISAGTEIKG